MNTTATTVTTVTPNKVLGIPVFLRSCYPLTVVAVVHTFLARLPRQISLNARCRNPSLCANRGEIATHSAQDSAQRMT